MAYKTKQYGGMVKPIYVIIGVIALVVISFGKSIINRLSSGLSFLGAKKDQSKLVDETLNNSNDVRFTFVKGIADFVHGELNKSWWQNQDETAIVAEMNKLQSPEEVIFCSNYYNGQHGVSLKAALKESLAADWRMSSGSYSALKTVVRNNLL